MVRPPRTVWTSSAAAGIQAMEMGRAVGAVIGHGPDVESALGIAAAFIVALPRGDECRALPDEFGEMVVGEQDDVAFPGDDRPAVCRGRTTAATGDPTGVRTIAPSGCRVRTSPARRSTRRSAGRRGHQTGPSPW